MSACVARGEEKKEEEEEDGGRELALPLSGGTYVPTSPAARPVGAKETTK